MRLCLGPRAYDVGTRALVVAIVDPGVGALADARGAGDADRLVALGRRLVAEGADVLDVVDTSAPSDTVGDDGGRVAAAVAALVTAVDVAVSVTTSRATVAAGALAAGATLVADRRRRDGGGHLAAAARAGASVVVVADPLAPGTDVVGAVAASLLAGVAEAAVAGITAECIVVDGGLDATAGPEEVLALLRASGRLAALGHPLALSAPDAVAAAALRLPATGRAVGLAAASVGVALGCRLVRTTDVRGARRVCDAIAAVLEAR